MVIPKTEMSNLPKMTQRRRVIGSLEVSVWEVMCNSCEGCVQAGCSVSSYSAYKSIDLSIGITLHKRPCRVQTYIQALMGDVQNGMRDVQNWMRYHIKFDLIFL